ncbi:type I methionyl aminopeptidase [uncultured Acetobacteroides sp.]|uniref:type I methionyl aminopeptidase n=1 Tax=uncultured Acetobacteroides sp. TaxID=1760811 RepID=UPI0029F5B3EA|nr:type I methionyl aminopeptidase [uncultured Acetobacteroides sp.]
MVISNEEELEGMKRISDAVAVTLKQMREHARVGMSTKELDEYGGMLLNQYGAKSAPKVSYDFPGWTCISLNDEIAHGIPSEKRILQEGDLINIDVSAELGGFFSDNGGSFVLGEDIHHHQKLVDASRNILRTAIMSIHGGLEVSRLGLLIETEAKRAGYKVIKDLSGHGVGRKLHEEPLEILNWQDRSYKQRFRKGGVVAIETFITTFSSYTKTDSNGWTLTGERGGFGCQHEHTILVTDSEPVILTEKNGIWD